MTSIHGPAAPDPRTRLARLPQLQHWLMVSLIGTLALLLLGFSAKLLPHVLSIELALDESLTDHQLPVLNAIGIGLSTIFSPPGAVVILALSFCFLLFVRRAPVNAFAFTGLAAFCWLSSEIFKIIVAEPRPNGALLDHPLLAEVGNNSFPSGHTTFIASFAIACYLLARGTRWQRTTAIAGIVAVVIMGAARLYVSGHYLTDVIGSVILASTAAVFFTGLWNLIGLHILNRLPWIDRLGPIPPVARPRVAH